MYADFRLSHTVPIYQSLIAASLSTIPGQNVDSMIFKEVMHELARKLGHLGKDFSDT